MILIIKFLLKKMANPDFKRAFEILKQATLKQPSDSIQRQYNDLDFHFCRLVDSNPESMQSDARITMKTLGFSNKLLMNWADSRNLVFLNRL